MFVITPSKWWCVVSKLATLYLYLQCFYVHAHQHTLFAPSQSMQARKRFDVQHNDFSYG